MKQMDAFMKAEKNLKKIGKVGKKFVTAFVFTGQNYVFTGCCYCGISSLVPETVTQKNWGALGPFQAGGFKCKCQERGTAIMAMSML